jgi:5'-nucleotidase
LEKPITADRTADLGNFSKSNIGEKSDRTDVAFGIAQKQISLGNMAFALDKKLVIAVSSSALFDLSEEDMIYRKQGEEAYRQYQRERIDVALKPGVAFPFIRRLLKFNSVFAATQPVEVVLLSKNDPESGLRIFRSINYYELGISRAAFLSGKQSFRYIPAFNASLFLSSDADDVRLAIDAGFPAGTVLKNKFEDDEGAELRLAFDFDCVLADDESETVYATSRNLDLFHQYEVKHATIPHKPGPLKNLLSRISYFQKLEAKKQMDDPHYKPLLRTAVVTARNAPSHERYVTTMKQWDLRVDETFFLGGIEKKRILEILKPHIYFDDQLSHLEAAVPSVHVPFGIANKKKLKP